MKRLTHNKADRESRTWLRVPATKSGERFLRELRKYSVLGVRITLRGRGSRRAAVEQASSSRNGKPTMGQYRQDLPREFASSFAVYIRKPGLERVQSEQNKRSMDYWVNREKENTRAALRQVEQVREALRTLAAFGGFSCQD